MAELTLAQRIERLAASFSSAKRTPVPRCFACQQKLFSKFSERFDQPQQMAGAYLGEIEKRTTKEGHDHKHCHLTAEELAELEMMGDPF